MSKSNFTLVVSQSTPFGWNQTAFESVGELSTVLSNSIAEYNKFEPETEGVDVSNLKELEVAKAAHEANKITMSSIQRRYDVEHEEYEVYVWRAKGKSIAVGGLYTDAAMEAEDATIAEDLKKAEELAAKNATALAQLKARAEAVKAKAQAKAMAEAKAEADAIKAEAEAKAKAKAEAKKAKPAQLPKPGRKK